jgi:hypothetical protein
MSKNYSFLLTYFRIKILSKYKKYRRLIYLKKKYPLQEGEICLICTFGIGDTILISSFSKYLLGQNGITKISLIVKPSHSFIQYYYDYFSRVITDFTIQNRIDISNSDLPMSQQKLLPGRYFYAHVFDSNIRTLVGFKNLTLTDCYRVIFKVNHNLSPIKPKKITEESIHAVKEFIFSNKIVLDKTILLCTASMSVESLGDTYWENLINSLVKNGYNIILNTPQNVKYDLNVKYLEIPLALVPAFTSLIFATISMRSGICDMISLFHTRLIVIYPFVKYFSSTLIEGTSLNKMGLACGRIFEVQVNNFEQQMSSIICITSFLKDPNFMNN